MGKLIDLTKRKFDRLEVICRAPDYVYQSGRKEVVWKCRCDCGKELNVLGVSLRNGTTKSCGCLWREIISTASKTHGACSNKTTTRLYSIWSNMKDRCTNPKHHAYMSYGGRGIKVCNEWINDFATFEDWALSHGYNDGLTIDRIDVDGDYCPTNCRWATRKEQANNKTNNRIIVVNGESKTLSEWSAISGVSTGTIWARINIYGWNAEKAVFTPVRGDAVVR